MLDLTDDVENSVWRIASDFRAKLVPSWTQTAAPIGARHPTRQLQEVVYSAGTAEAISRLGLFREEAL